MTVEHPRRIRSFVRRPGRLTTGQRRALDNLLPRFGIAYSSERFDPVAVFGRMAPCVLDIGFGAGEALLSAAAANPGVDYVGVEVHEPGVGHLLTLLGRSGIDNVRVIQHDAVDVIAAMLPDACVDAVNLFFPDPWPKKRHHKRRLVQAGFVDSVGRILKPAGLFRIATDWANYAEHIEAVVGASALFERLPAAAFSDNPLAVRAPTKFEARGRRLGHDVVDFCYRRLPPAD
jgi:tRNA (guanine-N7-)-methyltransferase